MCREKKINRCKELFSKTNKYDLSGEYGIGYDSNGQKFYFDLEDYDKIKNYCWYEDCNKSNCSTRILRAPKLNGPRGTAISMHEILGFKKK